RGTIAELKAWTRKLEVGRPNGDDKLIASQSALTATVTSTTRSTRKTQSKASSAAHSNDVNDHQGPKAILINPSSPNPMIEEVEYRGDDAHLQELLGSTNIASSVYHNDVNAQIRVHYNLGDAPGCFRLYDAKGSIELNGKALVIAVDYPLTIEEIAQN